MGKIAGIGAGIQVQLDAFDAHPRGVLRKASSRIHIARSADSRKQIGLFQRCPDLVHVVRDFAKPDDIRPGRLGATGGASIPRLHDRRRRPAMVAGRAKRP